MTDSEILEKVITIASKHSGISVDQLDAYNYMWVSQGGEAYNLFSSTEKSIERKNVLKIVSSCGKWAV